MKKILFLAVFTLISVAAFSQRVTYSKGLYDSYNNQYIKTTVQNTSRKSVVCLEFIIEYDYPSRDDIRRYESTTVRVNITSGASKTFTYYPPKKSFKAITQYLTKAIYSDGTYKEF